MAGVAVPGQNQPAPPLIDGPTLPGGQPGAPGPAPTNLSGPIFTPADGTPPVFHGIVYDASRWATAPPFEEIPEMYREENTQTETRITRGFRTWWSWRHAFREWMLGDARAAAGTQSQSQTEPEQLQRRTPDQMPDRPWLYCIAADLIRGEGVGLRAGNSWLPGGDPAAKNPPTRGGVPDIPELVTFAWGKPGFQPNFASKQASFSDGYAVFQCTYTHLNYAVRSDDEVQRSKFGELSRWVERSEEPSIQSLPLYRIAGAGLLAAQAAAASRAHIADRANQAAGFNGSTQNSVFVAAFAASLGGPFQATVQQAAQTFVPTTDGLQAAAIILAAVDAQLKIIAAAGAPQTLTFTEGPFAGQEIPEAGVLLMPSKQVKFTWRHVPDRNLPVWDAALGKISNDDPFDGTSTGYPSYPKGTLLLLTYKDEPSRGTTGRVQWDVSFYWGFRPSGWQKWPAPDGLYYSASFGGGAGPTVYQSANMQALFSLPNQALEYQTLTG